MQSDTPNRRRSIGIIILVVLALAVSACGTLAEKATEQIVEQAIESGEGGEVDLDIDTDAGTFSVETEDGSMQVGSGLDLPANLEIPVPTGGNVTSTQSGDGYAQALIAFPRERLEELVEFYEDWVDSQSGVFQTSNSQYSNDGELFRKYNWFAYESGVSVGVSDCYSSSGEGIDACVSVLDN